MPLKPNQTNKQKPTNKKYNHKKIENDASSITLKFRISSTVVNHYTPPPPPQSQCLWAFSSHRNIIGDAHVTLPERQLTALLNITTKLLYRTYIETLSTAWKCFI